MVVSGRVETGIVTIEDVEMVICMLKRNNELMVVEEVIKRGSKVMVVGEVMKVGILALYLMMGFWG